MSKSILMNIKSGSSSKAFRPVMLCPVSGEVSYFDYDHNVYGSLAKCEVCGVKIQVKAGLCDRCLEIPF